MAATATPEQMVELRSIRHRNDVTRFEARETVRAGILTPLDIIAEAETNPVLRSIPLRQLLIDSGVWNRKTVDRFLTRYFGLLGLPKRSVDLGWFWDRRALQGRRLSVLTELVGGPAPAVTDRFPWA